LDLLQAAREAMSTRSINRVVTAVLRPTSDVFVLRNSDILILPNVRL
jgi:hypothetical protein